MSLAGYGAAHALSQIFLVAPVTRWIGERGAVLFGMAVEAVAVVAMTLVPEGWMVFVLLPLFALAGVGAPALQSLISIEAGNRQGQMQGVLSSLMSLTAVAAPLFFSLIYAGTKDIWPGTVWIVGISIYVLAVAPLLPPRKVNKAVS